MMKSKLLWAGWLGLLALVGAGCAGDPSQPFDLQSLSGRANALRVVDSTPDLAVNGDAAQVVTARGYDPAGRLVFGPIERPYSGDILFKQVPPTVTRVELDYQRAQGYSLVKRFKNVNFAEDDDGEVVVNEESTPLLGAAQKSTFTVRIVNNSDYDDSQVFISVNGKNRQKTAFYYLQFGANDSNTFQPFQGTAQWDSYSQKLSQLKSEGGHAYSFQCPYDDLVSGRIYLSFGKKLQGLGLNNLADPLSLQLPSATGAPDYQTLYEFLELSATIPDDPNAPQVYTLFTNTSVVDFFSIGIGMTMSYQSGGSQFSESVGFEEGARDKILTDFDANAPAEFKRYINSPNGNRLRVLAPVQIVSIDPNGDASRFMQSVIDSTWAAYAGTALNIPDTLSPTLGYKWTGVPVLNNILSMTCTAKPAGDTASGDLQSLGEVCNLPKPTSRILFFCDDDAPFNPAVTPTRNTWRNDGSDGHKRLVSLLSAAFNRGVADNYNNWDKPSTFYTRPDGRYNHFSKILHKYALNGKVYGFGYDDVYGQDPTLARTLSDVNQVTITIPKVAKL